MFFALAKKELLALSRDVHGLAALFVLPMVFIIVMSMALKDVYAPKQQAMRYAVVNLDHSAQSEQLLKAWNNKHGAPTELTADAAQDAVRTGHLKYLLRIDAGFAQALEDMPEGEAAAGSEKVHFLAEPGLDTGLFESTYAQLVMQVAQLRTASMLKALNVEGDTDSASRVLFSNSLVQAARASKPLGQGPRPSSVQHSVPGWLVFGMFFVVASIAGLFVDERSCGALARLRSLGAKPATLLAAKVVPYMLVNGVQAVLMLSVGVWLMPLLGGDALSLQGISWSALVLMLLAISVAAISLALAIACLVRTHAQASALGPILNVLMAALGGIMVPLFVMPEVMQHIAAYSPMNWGLEGLLGVLLRGADCSAVLPFVGRLGAFAVLMLACAYGLLKANWARSA